MKKILFILMSVLLALSLSAGSVFATQDTTGKELSIKLLQSSDPQAFWEKLSESDKTKVREFAKQASGIIKELSSQNASISQVKAKAAALSEDVKIALQVSLIQVGYETGVEPIISPLSVVQYYAEAYYKGTNVFGGELYRLTHRITYNSDGQWIVNPAPYRTITPSVSMVGWSYEGTITDEQRGGTGYNFYESNVVGHFKFNVVYDIQNTYPRIWLKGWANGTYDYEVSR